MFEPLLAGKCPSHDLCGECAHSPSEHPSGCASPLRFRKFPAPRGSDGVSQCSGTFPPSGLSPWGTGPRPTILCFPCRLCLLPHFIPREIMTLQRFSVLCQCSRSCSMGIVPHAMVFYVFVGENIVSPSDSSTIWKVPPWLCS